MKRVILVMAIFTLACSQAESGGGSGGGDPSPIDACNDFCDRLTQCGWGLPGYDSCNVDLCEGPVMFHEGDVENCDDAMVDYFLCDKNSSCPSLQWEPCPVQLAKMFRECPWAEGRTEEEVTDN